jgi:succinate-semialdehyde dehydrogenase/glutarate-semialdehyde dehydrogenase
MKIRSIDPFTERILREYEALEFGECAAAASKAREALRGWRELGVSVRSECVRKAGALLKAERRRYAELATREMGKPIAQSLAEIDKCAWLCDFYAEAAAGFLRDEVVETGAAKSYVAFEPLGVILGVMPWNFPFWQVFRFAIPAMAAGNACLLKHASNVPGTALEIEKIMMGAGFPPGLFRTLLIGPEAAMKLIAQDLVDGVSLTGSVEAGARVGAVAGAGLKKLVLELGGSDPFIVLEDAELPGAVETAVASRFLNGGQSCIAAKRMIVAAGVFDEFFERLAAAVAGFTIGDPMDEAVFIGPMAKRESVNALGVQLEDAVRKGARIVRGPVPPAGPGFFFRPALLGSVSTDMKVMTEEVFGPIAPVISAAGDEEILRLANSADFGLGASVWSRDLDRAARMARRLETGCVAINDMVKSDPRLPFGGVKKSGFGRELSHFGLKEFTNAKTVVIR